MSSGKTLVYATIVSTFILIVWGAYLTAGDFGNACGVGGAMISSDWPYCNGTLAIPFGNWGAMVEYIHRTLSVVTTLFLVVTLLAVWRMKPRPSGAYRALALSFILLLVQIALGDVVVGSSLNAAVTALHLANATALFGAMVVSGVLMYVSEKRPY